MSGQSKMYGVPISRLAEHIGDKVLDLLDDRDVTVAWLARATGLTRMGIYKILYGSIHVRVDTLERLGAALGVEAGWFLEGYRHDKV